MNESMSYSDFRENLKLSLDKVCNNHIPLLVTRKTGENVVVVSEDDYKSMEETAYLLSSPTNASRLQESLQESAKTRHVFKTIAELKASIGL